MDNKETQYWLFVDSKTRVVSRRLTQKGAEDFIESLQNVNIDHWWAWNPSFCDWIPLKNILNRKDGKIRILIKLPTINMPLDNREEELTIAEDVMPEQSEHTHIPEEYSEVKIFLSDKPADAIRDFHGDDLTFSHVPKPPTLGFGADRRRANRYEKRIEVLVASRGKSFRTHTVNISMTGVMLELAIPKDLHGGPFEIVFIIQEKGIKKQIAFQGKVSGDSKDRRRLVFGELNTSCQKVLESLFIAN